MKYKPIMDSFLFLLKKRKMTCHALALRSGVSANTIGNIVHQKYRAVHELTAERISKALRVEMDEVFEME